MAAKVGDQIADFTLTDDKGKPRRLGESLEKGPVVLAFFPLAFSAVCTSEMCEFRDELKSFEGLKATVHGVSVDSFYALGAFSQAQNLNFPLLSDFNKDVGKAFGNLYEDFYGMKGVHKRSAFVLDKTGKLAYAWSSDDAQDRPNLEEIRAALTTLG